MVAVLVRAPSTEVYLAAVLSAYTHPPTLGTRVDVLVLDGPFLRGDDLPVLFFGHKDEVLGDEVGRNFTAAHSSFDYRTWKGEKIIVTRNLYRRWARHGLFVSVLLKFVFWWIGSSLTLGYRGHGIMDKFWYHKNVQ